VNGDGFDDVLIGAPNAEVNGRIWSGDTYVVFGRASGFDASIDLADLDGRNGFILKGIERHTDTGSAVSGAGDVNGDGIDDILIGSPGGDGNGWDHTGETYVVFGRASGFDASIELADLDGSNGFVLNGVDGNDASASAVSGAGDVNGDGINDILIGARYATAIGEDTHHTRELYDIGETYVVFGRASGFDASIDLADLNGSNGFVLNGIDEGDQSGFAVSGAGDVNGDGFDDVLIGAPRDIDANEPIDGPRGSGESYLVFGRASGFDASVDLADLDGSNGFILKGIDVGDFSGWSVSGAGDVNDDGIDDILIGAFGAHANGQYNSGETYVVFGGATLNNLDVADGARDGSIDLANLSSALTAIVGTDGNDALIGTTRDDHLIGIEGQDNLRGLRGHDLLEGGLGVDTLIGDHGDDTLDGGAGADVMKGGYAADTYYVDNIGDQVQESSSWLGRDSVISSIDFAMGRSHIEDLTLTGNAVSGTGNGLGNTITGNAGNNILDGGRGIDTLIGGLGDDTYILRHRGDIAQEVGLSVRQKTLNAAVNGHDTVLAHNSFRLAFGIEDILLQDVIGRNGQAVNGLTAIGNNLDNLVQGNAANNSLNGRTGNDTLTGGAGADEFMFTDPLGAQHADTITDFTTGEDRIVIKGALVNVARGVVDAEAFHLGSAATTADHRFTFDGTTLRYDADGSGGDAAQIIATLDGAPTLMADDIFIA
jgi:hypothetical protein